MKTVTAAQNSTFVLAANGLLLGATRDDSDVSRQVTTKSVLQVYVMSFSLSDAITAD